MRRSFSFFLLFTLLTGQISAVSFEDCLTIHAPAQRLACYDAKAGYTAPDISRTDAASSSPPPLAQYEPSTTVLEEPNQFAKPAIPEPLTPAPQAKRNRKSQEPRIYPITRIDKTISGKILVYLADGQVWQQTDSVRVRIRKNAPKEATIKPAALGSFFLKLPDQRQFRAKRVQ